jgi:hypothetical protein
MRVHRISAMMLFPCLVLLSCEGGAPEAMGPDVDGKADFASGTSTSSEPETCDNGRDDNGDSLIDCDDSDCWSNSSFCVACADWCEILFSDECQKSEYVDFPECVNRCEGEVAYFEEVHQNPENRPALRRLYACLAASEDCADIDSFHFRIPGDHPGAYACEDEDAAVVAAMDADDESHSQSTYDV